MAIKLGKMKKVSLKPGRRGFKKERGSFIKMFAPHTGPPYLIFSREAGERLNLSYDSSITPYVDGKNLYILVYPDASGEFAITYTVKSKTTKERRGFKIIRKGIEEIPPARYAFKSKEEVDLDGETMDAFVFEFEKEIKSEKRPRKDKSKKKALVEVEELDEEENDEEEDEDDDDDDDELDLDDLEDDDEDDDDDDDDDEDDEEEEEPSPPTPTKRKRSTGPRRRK